MIATTGIENKKTKIQMVSGAKQTKEAAPRRKLGGKKIGRGID
jgi:hypothetical protein